MKAEAPNPGVAAAPAAIAAGGLLPQGSALLAAVCGALALTASLANFLDHNNYPLLQPEVGATVAALLALAAAAGCLYHLAGRLGRIAMEALLAILFVDLNFDGTGMLIAALAGVVVLRHHTIPLLGMTSAAVLATAVISSATGPSNAVGSPSRSGAAAPNLPVVLHLVLDEHLGVEGFRRGFEPAERMAEELKTFYAEQRFKVFGGAYSQHRRTVNAIPQMLNFGETQPWQSDNVNGIRLANNRYFDRLRALGYRLTVYQTDFVDYCGASAGVETCWETPKSGLAPVAASRLPMSDKAMLVLHGFFSLSAIVQNVGYRYDRLAVGARQYGFTLPLVQLNLWSQVSTIGALDAFDRLIVDLGNAKPGQAYFAHLLFPHYPYVVDQHCTLKRLRDWRVRRSPAETREARETAYFDQLRCVMVKIDLALQALAGAGVASNSIVIVHGDHGSRISENEPTAEALGSLNADDLVSHHLTLFAVRAPAIEPSYEPRLLPIDELIRSLAASGFESAEVALPRTFTPMIILEDLRWKPVQPYKLPAPNSH